MDTDGRNPKFQPRRLAPMAAAKAFMDRGNPFGRFESDLWLLGEFGGHIIVGPECFLMCRAVRREASEEQLADLTHRFAAPNAWYVWLAAGSVPAIMGAMPYFLEWIGFRRGDRCRRVHWHRTYRLRRRIQEMASLTRGNSKPCLRTGPSSGGFEIRNQKPEGAIYG
jgi:hypothetical protein